MSNGWIAYYINRHHRTAECCKVLEDTTTVTVSLLLFSHMKMRAKCTWLVSGGAGWDMNWTIQRLGGHYSRQQIHVLRMTGNFACQFQACWGSPSAAVAGRWFHLEFLQDNWLTGLNLWHDTWTEKGMRHSREPVPANERYKQVAFKLLRNWETKLTSCKYDVTSLTNPSQK